MNFDYSYKALLITSLLTGCLVLILFSIKLRGELAENEETYEVIAAEVLPLPEEPEIASLSQEKVKIETNRAYNEAEKFISSVENEAEEKGQTTEEKLKEMNEAIEASQNGHHGVGTSVITKAEKPKKASNAKLESEKAQKLDSKRGNRNTTVSYQLVNRDDLELPNPVYTCSGSGKVVINIEVNNLGKVVNNSYNNAASTTTNACLIDAALEYSGQARFTTDASRDLQLGTITFHFPGQQ